ncbi:hypothetical protein KUTeg_015440 [Tegillarca granosa]|uniref:Uncharacterized protein n=1 Tax=Tegillarca granosa TaxID=220873 RepID=A0ABQ9EQ42_TEGGR|nr:hypothetical protein KUTeg_015440 [Tegillarca granosa]
MVSMDRDREEFHQFYTLVQEKGGIVLRNVIQYLYNEDGILNFEQFLTHYKHKLFHELWQPNKACCPFGGPTCYKSEPSKKPILTGTQWMQLYKKNLSSMPHRDIGPCPCQWIAQTAKDLIDELDFTLLCQILKNIYAANKLSKLQLDATDLVKSERNKLSHPKQLKVEDFTTRWEKVKNSLLDLAKICFQPDQLKSLEDDIDRLKTRPVTNKDFENLEKIIIYDRESQEQLHKKLKKLIVYIKEEYEALDEENWKEIEAIRYPVQTVKKKNEIQKAEIDKKLKKAVIEEHLCRSAQCQNEIRVVIVGKTGVGKSALGNLLLQIPSYFEESIGPSSMTAGLQEQ